MRPTEPEGNEIKFQDSTPSEGALRARWINPFQPKRGFLGTAVACLPSTKGSSGPCPFDRPQGTGRAVGLRWVAMPVLFRMMALVLVLVAGVGPACSTDTVVVQPTSFYAAYTPSGRFELWQDRNHRRVWGNSEALRGQFASFATVGEIL